MRHFGSTVAAITLALWASAAQAELVVVSQSGTVYKPDQHLSDEATLVVPKGARLKLKRLPDGKDVELQGPYKGALADYKTPSGCPWWKPFCKPDKGEEPGAVRGVRPGAIEEEQGATRGIR